MTARTPKRTIPSPDPAAPLKRGPRVNAGANRHSAGSGTSRGGRREGAGRPPRADDADRRLEIRCTEGERAVLDDASGTQPTGTWARDVLMREAGRILAERQRHDDTDGCAPYLDGDGVCEVCGERAEVARDESEDAHEREAERATAARYAASKEG